MPGSLWEELQDLIGYRFRQPELLLEALTHSSFTQEDSRQGRDNERLEFLGDAVLNFLVTVRLSEAFPRLEEGDLSRARARLVTAAHLSQVAQHLELGRYLRLGRGEEHSGGRNKSTLRVDALEALLAAIYRDGGMEAARSFVERFVLPEDLEASAERLLSTDHKSALQEYLQSQRLSPASYHVVEEKGPEHRKTFVVEAASGNGLRARGRGGSKKAAEQQAAQGLMERLKSGERADE
jgi:ribonuclease III